MTGFKLRHFTILLCAIAALAVGVTFHWAVAYSAFAAALAKASLIVVLFASLDRYALESIDTIEQLRKGNVAVAIALLALALLLAPAIATGQPVVDEASKHVGVTETPPGSNEGEDVERFLASVGLGDGYPWCSAFVSYVLDAAGAPRPDVRSAVATDFLGADQTIDATRVLRTGGRVPPGALSVHRRGSTWKGHIGVVTGDDRAWRYDVTRWQGRCGRTIEGNTSPQATASAGPQRDGEGVWRRTRCINPGSYFRIVGFVPTSS